ncbi:MAG: hypothetical protein QW350_05215 [Candidatus Aenigmatarchaeota archaeon]|jgi:hypothetical protein
MEKRSEKRKVLMKKLLIASIVVIVILTIFSYIISIITGIIQISQVSRNVSTQTKNNTTPSITALQGELCGKIGGSLDKFHNKIKIKNNCFVGLYVFINSFDEQSAILNKIPTVFKYQGNILTDDNHVLSPSFDKEKKIIVVPKQIISSTIWIIKNGTIQNSVGIKWTVKRVEDRNGFYVYRVTYIPIDTKDDISSSWDVEIIE